MFNWLINLFRVKIVEGYISFFLKSVVVFG